MIELPYCGARKRLASISNAMRIAPETKTKMRMTAVTLPAFAQEVIDDDLRPPMSQLRAGHRLLVFEPESPDDALRRIIARVEDRDCAWPRQRFEHVAHRRAAGFGRVAAAPHIAREPPSDLKIAGGA